MGAIDAGTGIYLYDETDSQATFSGLLNLAQTNTKAAVANLQALIGAQSNTARNYVYNSNAAVAQRGTAFTATGHTFDRWHATITASTLSRATNAETDTLFQNAYSFNVLATAAMNSCVLRQGYITEDVAQMRGKTMTLSMPVRSTNATNSITIAIERSATADSQITGTWTTINSVTVTPGTDGMIASVSAAIPQNATARGLRISITTTNLANASSVSFGDLILEPGTVRSFYRLRNTTISGEIEECQAFFERFTGTGTVAVGQAFTATRAGFVYTYKATKRTPITSAGFSTSAASTFGLSLAGGSTQAASTTPTFGNATDNTAYFFCDVAGNLVAGNATVLVGNSYRIDFSAELP